MNQICRIFGSGVFNLENMLNNYSPITGNHEENLKYALGEVSSRFVNLCNNKIIN